MAPTTTTLETLRALPLFADLPATTLETLWRGGSVEKLERKQALSALDRRGTENYYIVLEGRLAVTLHTPIREAGKDPKVEFIGSFGQGDCFSDGYLDARGPAGTAMVDCSANPKALVWRTDRATFQACLAKDSALANRLAYKISGSRNHFLSQQEPTRRLVQDFYLRHGYDGGGFARVGQTDLCLDCNKCEEACAKRHGTARMSRSGPTLGRLIFHQVCRECTDRPCLEGCKPGAIALSPKGEVVIDDRCTGCGICARKCPYGAISLVETMTKVSDPHALTGLSPTPAKPRKQAVKCDHCAGYSDLACFRACPTGALVEIRPRALFTESLAGSFEDNFTGVPFLEGVREHRARAKRGPWYTLLTIGLFLALIAVGLESFLRRLMPEHSLSHFLYPQLGWTHPVTFASGKGFGHWLGYIGTGFMLLTVFYPLRTRLGLLKNWGAQSEWLTVHLWVGFIGATLVTYHSVFKLDRWAGISCIAMWIVIASGAIGRYLYGMVHSGIGLVELEQSAMKRHQEVVARHRTSSQAVRVLTGDFEGPPAHRGILVVMLWLALRDTAVLLWLRWFGLTHIHNPAVRKLTLRFLADWATHRRNRHYLESAKRMLRHWNWVHIILTIVMFAIAGVHITYGWIYKAV